jgi:hypothetical protein
MELTAIVPEASSTEAQVGPAGGAKVRPFVSLIVGATPPCQVAVSLQLPELTFQVKLAACDFSNIPDTNAKIMTPANATCFLLIVGSILTDDSRGLIGKAHLHSTFRATRIV